MPYTMTGCDSAGERHDYEMDEACVVTGDALLTGWLADNPLTPFEGESPTDAELEQVRQHVSKLLTVVQLARIPVPDAEPKDTPAADAAPPPDASHPRYTAEELDAMTVADLREFAHAAQIAGAPRMTKAELVAALLAEQGG